MEDKQEDGKLEQPFLQVNKKTFSEVSRGDDYVLYQARESHMLGDITVDFFLEFVPDKGWWGAIRLDGRFRIQLCLNRETLFPTPEIALLAIEEFVADEQHVRVVLEDMRKEKVNLKTFNNVPPRSVDVDPDKYFSPILLKVNGDVFTLHGLTKTAASYRSWGQQPETEMVVDLRLTHVYWKGWQAGLRFFGSHMVMFEPALDQDFLTAESALETLLAFCAEEDSMRNLAQQLRKTDPQNMIVIRRDVTLAPVAAKSPLRVSKIDFVWQKRISEGDLYQEKIARFAPFKKASIQLVETWDRGWLGSLQSNDFSGIYFEKESGVGFSTPEEALAAIQKIVALKEEGMPMLRAAHARRMLLQCKIGRYDQLLSVSVAKDA